MDERDDHVTQLIDVPMVLDRKDKGDERFQDGMVELHDLPIPFC